jgi:hypothetical protein
LHGFPLNEPKRLKRWVTALNRAGGKPGSLWSPTKHSKLCSLHFDEGQYKCTQEFADSISYGGLKRLRLKPDAIPNIFPKPNAPAKVPPKIRSAVVKRTKIRNRKVKKTEADSQFPWCLSCCFWYTNTRRVLLLLIVGYG